MFRRSRQANVMAAAGKQQPPQYVRVLKDEAIQTVLNEQELKQIPPEAPRRELRCSGRFWMVFRVFGACWMF